MELAHAAGAQMQAGRLDEAAALWERVLSLDPHHPAALLHAGQHALHRGNIAGATQLLERAARSDPANPVVALNQSFVFRRAGDLQREADALTRALAIDPYFLPALLARGALLERAGQTRQAAKVYQDVLTIVPDGARVDDWLREPLAHARDVVDQNRRALSSYLDDRLAGARARHDGASLARFEEARDVMIGTRKAQLSKPTLLHFPTLPALAFHDRADFPWLAEVEAATDTIRDELSALLAANNPDFGPYVRHPEGAPLNQWAALNNSLDWSAWFLLKDGAPVGDHCDLCPKTAALLRKLPLADIPRIAPSAFFSVLKPKTRIPPHHGVTNARVIVHVPLIVPPGCWFRVGNQTREWEPGKALVFDDSIEHEAYNGSDRIRIVLIFDTWNPLLTAAERELVRDMLVAAEDYYGAGGSWA
jgi:aspartate beta-hydroxylase